MNVRLLLLWVTLSVAMWPATLPAQGFAGLGTATEGYATPEQGRRLVFPEDHYAHPEYRIEWWYLTMNLQGADGQSYGAQWTLFRSALATGGAASDQAWMGHAAVTTPDGHYFGERLARGDFGQAGIAQPFSAFIDDWQMTSTAAASEDMYQSLHLTARGQEFAYDLDLTATGPLVLHGDAGYSVKSDTGQASYYYSQPFYSVDGVLNLPDGPVQVTGSAWLDREWSSQPLEGDQTGWDWFSLHFDDGNKLMGFRLRGANSYTAGTWIAPDGTPTPFGNGDLIATPLAQAQVANRDIPVEWRLELPKHDVDVTVVAQQPDAWMNTVFPYWEGPVSVTGSHAGQGYLEMTGY